MSEKRYYMACLDLTGRSCLVVGGGSVGLEKTRGLIDCGARVIVVAPEIVPKLRELSVELLERRFENRDLEGRFLVVAATSDADLNRRVFEAAEARLLLCNVVDAPEICNFILPAVHRADPIAIAITTSGASPALAQRIKREVAEQYGVEYADLARRLGALRPWAKENLATYEERRDFFQALVEEALA
jgi:precorrin-2 dehydrogenase / sirohydrochlorin ferrochelatase